MSGAALAGRVSTKRAVRRTTRPARVRVAVVDYGAKRSILRRLAGAGAAVTVFPHDVDADTLAGFDGVLLSNGPGDPEPLDGRGRGRARAARPRAGARHLPRPPAARARDGLAHVQAPVRPPRREPPGARARDGPRARHEPEPRLRRRGERRPRTSRTSRSTTAPSRASPTRSCARARCSSTPRPGRARTTPGRSSPSGSRRCALPRRDDIESICLIGSGPIVIGQACEFDYAGCQALKVLRDDGYRDDRRQLEPGDDHDRPRLRRPHLPRAARPRRRRRRAAARAARRAAADDGRPDGAQPRARAARGRRARRARRRADRRERRRDRARRGPRALQGRRSSRAGSACRPRASSRRSNELDGVGLPAVVRPAFTLGGHGGGFVSTAEELHRQVERGLAESPIGQVLVEESVRGWDEFELEVVRDRADNVVIVCSIENLDPMGVHTGDSVTVAPQMTLSDEAYQELRDAAVAVIRAVGVDTGGSNIQFARDRRTGELRVIEMNPRVSRSSALASKATGYPIAKVAAKLAVGYTLDEIPNDLTGTTPASFEPTLDYVVVKFPRFAFEKFPGADTTLGTQMKSVGESMGIGRTFAEAFAKARRGLDTEQAWEPENLHPWFAAEIADCGQLAEIALCEADSACGKTVYRRVDSCAGEVEASSNYFYSTRGEADEAPPEPGRSVVILGSGPNRIGQGIEFDYCCVHAAQSFRAQGYEAVMVNCNPETVSTDYDTSRPPLLRAARRGGRARRARARAARRRLHPVRRPDAAQARARDRARRLPHPRHAVRRDRPRRGPRALRAARGRGRRALPGVGDRAARRRGGGDRGADRLPGARPAVVRARRPRDARLLRRRATSRRRWAGSRARCSSTASSRTRSSSTSTRSATARDTYVAAVMEHVEEAGIHSRRLVVRAAGAVRRRARCATLVRRLGPALGVVGLLNVQLAIVGGEVYVLEVNPRASRTVPFASKATGVNLVDAACRLAAGATLAELGLPPESLPRGLPRQGGRAAVRALPRRRPGARARDALDRRGDGERRRLRLGVRQGRARRGPAAAHRRARVPQRARPRQGGRPAGRARAARARLRARRDRRHGAARSPTTASRSRSSRRATPVVHLVRRRGVDLVVNTPEGRNARTDGYAIREAAVVARVPCITTLAVARAAVEAIAKARAEPARTLQERHAEARAS